MPPVIRFLPALVLFVPFSVDPAFSQVTSSQVKDAIRDGVGYLKNHQRANGSWMEWTSVEKHGITALATFSMLSAGVDPQDPSIQKAVRVLKNMDPDTTSTYTLSFQTMVLCLENPRANLPLIQKNVEWFEDRQWQGDPPRAGGWGYNHKGKDFSRPDNSISQVALLALHEAQIAGARVQPKTWLLAKQYWEGQQNLRGAKAGGFCYENPASGRMTGSMTCAGISSLIIATENALTLDDILQDGKIRCCGQTDEGEYRLQRAFQWMTRNFTVASNANKRQPGNKKLDLYYLYSLERAGRLAGKRFFGKHDWYREGAEVLVSERGGRDYWSFFHDGRPSDIKVTQNTIGTAFGLLFLAKGLRPIVIGKYQHGEDDDWDLHRKGVHFLTRETEKAWKRKLNWQAIDGRRASVNDLLEAPVLFISGRKSFQLTEEQKENLQEYVNQGGFIFAEACQGDGCDPGKFDAEFTATMEEIFNSEFQLLDSSHPVWNSNRKVLPNKERPILGLQACCRTSVIYCPANLSCFWQLNQPRFRELLKGQNLENMEFCSDFGVNVLTYATNRELRDRLERPKMESTSRDDVSPDQIEVAKILHAGGADDAAVALKNLMQTARREASIPFSLKKNLVSITDPKVYQYPILFMHGRSAFEFSEKERKALKKMIREDGYFLLADSICASPAFTDSFRREMQLIFPEVELKPLDQSHELFSSQFGSDISTVVLRTPIQNVEPGGQKFRETRTLPRLEGLVVGNSVAIVFSPFDLSCALENAKSVECQGYRTDDAARIGVNVLRYALNREVPD
ncbi:MAG: DUF4159 domain-containing protein [Planctomycetota bacterium]|nr:DUF4159 domain-containing protein [Planctomycetota bacterium]